MNNNPNFNQGTNYMNQGGPQPVPPMPPQQPMVQQPMAQAAQQPQMQGGVSPVNQQAVPIHTPTSNAAQPQQSVINTDALKTKADNLASNAKNKFNVYLEKLKTNKKVLLGTIIGGVLVLILVMFIFTKLFNPSANVINKYMGILKSGKADKITRIVHDEILEAKYDGDTDVLVDYMEDRLDALDDSDIKIKSYKIRDCETYSDDEVKDLAEVLEESYDIEEKLLKAAKKYFVKVVVDEDGEKNIEYMEIVVLKIGSKWTLYSF